MGYKHRKILAFGLILLVLAGKPSLGLARRIEPLTLSAALERVFSSNNSLALFMWEQSLVEKRENLEKHPIIKFSATPAEIANGDLKNPQADFSASMALSESLDLSGRIGLELDQSGVEVTPAGSLNLKYKILGNPQLLENKGDPTKSLRQYENSLVLQTVDLLFDLRLKLDQQALTQARIKLLEDQLEAGQSVPDFDDLKLKQELRDQKTSFLTLQTETTSLQIELLSLLGATEDQVFDPWVEVVFREFNLDEADYLGKTADFSASWQSAKTNLENAQSKLAYESKTAGWNLAATGNVSLDQTWNIKLSASKDLYPRRIILEELSLQVAKAEQEFETAERNLRNQVRSAIQGIKNAEKNRELQVNNVADATKDLELRERQFVADLVTEFQVREARLELQRKKLDYDQALVVWGKSVLKLWDQCGYNLIEHIGEIMN